MKVGEMCTRGVIYVGENTALREVAIAMREHQVGAVVVTATGSTSQPTAAGIITDRDIVRAQLEHVADLSRIRVADVMSMSLLTLNVDQSLETAIDLMRSHRVRRAPVVDAGERLIGFVSVDDLVAELARQLSTLAGLLERQPRQHSLNPF